MLTLGPLTFTESKLALRRKGITATTDSARMFPLLRFETMKIRQTIDPLDNSRERSFLFRSENSLLLVALLMFLPFPISFVAHLLFFSFSVWVGSLAIGLTFFLGSLGSLLCQTIGCRFTSILGCLVCAVSLLVTPHSTSLEWMFLTYRCVFGIGSALMLSSYFLITAKNFRRWQSLAVGIVTVGGSSGLLIMGPLLQLLIDIFGWRGTYRILSIPFL